MVMPPPEPAWLVLFALGVLLFMLDGTGQRHPRWSSRPKAATRSGAATLHCLVSLNDAVSDSNQAGPDLLALIRYAAAIAIGSIAVPGS